MGIFFLTAFVFLSVGAYAQNVWHPGVLVNAKNEVMVGKLLIHQDHDVVLVRNDEGTAVMPAWKIQSFRFYDSTANLNRKFIALGSDSASIETKLYEVVVEGDIRVIRRKKAFPGGSVPDRDGFEYYFVYDDRVFSLRRFRTTLYPELRKALVHVEESLGLNPNRSDDVIRYIQHYNRLDLSSIVAVR